MAKVALGKGLSALINPRVASPTPVAESGERVQNVALDQIVPTPLQPRTDFRGERLLELIESIKVHGIIQPLIVRQNNGKYELIAGERRWRAACEIGLDEAPIIVRKATDQEVLELALIENLQREDLNPIEEAQAFARLAREFGLKQEEIAQKVGKSRAGVANSMRLLELHPDIQAWLTQGRVSVGHAKVLLSLEIASGATADRGKHRAPSSHGARGREAGGKSFRETRDAETDAERTPRLPRSRRRSSICRTGSSSIWRRT